MLGLTQDPHALQWMLAVSCLTNIIWMVVTGVSLFKSAEHEVVQVVELPGPESTPPLVGIVGRRGLAL